MWRSLIDWYAYVPADLSAGEGRTFTGDKIGYTVWIIVQGLSAYIFLQLDQSVLATYSGASTLIIAASFYCLVSGRPGIGYLLVNGQSILAVILTTVFVGLEPGFFLFALVGLVFCTLSEWVGRGIQHVVMGANAAAFIGALVLGLMVPPIAKLPPSWELIFAIFNGAGTAGMLVMVALTYRQMVDVAEAALESEHQKSETLLQNILPPAIADRLKQNPKVIADRHEEVTILFADIVGFTDLAGKLTAEELVTLLNRLFSQFDSLVEEMGVEKIKTIGDAYLVVAGLPVPREDHAIAMADFAQRMIEATNQISEETGSELNIRVGIHSGSVVAGVIGKIKFAYDLWGDAVNIAARMESHGEIGRVHVSAATAALLVDHFEVEQRGTIQIKGKGEMETFFLRQPD